VENVQSRAFENNGCMLACSAFTRIAACTLARCKASNVINARNAGTKKGLLKSGSGRLIVLIQDSSLIGNAGIVIGPC
jgi:hypothetical protein